MIKLLLSLVFIISLEARERKVDLNKMNLEDIESFFYEKGLKDGIKKGYRQGYSEALGYAKSKLNRYSSKIRAIEYGKYLNDRISSPEVYQVKDKFGNIKVIVKGCKFEKPLRADEIISLPIFPSDICSDRVISRVNYSNQLSGLQYSNDISNSANVIKRDDKLFSGRLKDTTSDNSRVFYYIPNQRFFRNKLSQLNMIYTIENDKIKVIFQDQQERDEFIRNFLGR